MTSSVTAFFFLIKTRIAREQKDSFVLCNLTCPYSYLHWMDGRGFPVGNDNTGNLEIKKMRRNCLAQVPRPQNRVCEIAKPAGVANSWRIGASRSLEALEGFGPLRGSDRWPSLLDNPAKSDPLCIWFMWISAAFFFLQRNPRENSSRSPFLVSIILETKCNFGTDL